MDDPSEKGQELRLIHGTYKGKTAWVNPHKPPTKHYISVIILDDHTGGEFKTRVRRTSVGKPLSRPTSFEEAALQQHPMINTMMENLAKQLAMCNIQAGNQNIHAIFDHMIEKSNKMQADDQENALWKSVDYKEKRS
jgi:hypothetical protein